MFRVRGVPIRAHWTLLLILPYLAFVLSLRFRGVAQLAGVHDTSLLLPPLVWGAVLAIGLFASITLHELAHSFLAIRFGGRVRSITLMLVGGVSELAHAPRRPRDEALVAAVGPATSLVLGALFANFYSGAHAWPDLQMALFYLAAMNVMLGVFNMIPAFPMDGGRVLRAALATKLDRERATRIAASVGKVCAILLGILGLWSANILLLLVALFVYTGAQGEIVQERVRAALEGLRIVDLIPMMKQPLPTISRDALVIDVLPRMRELDRLELVVVDSVGTPLTVIRAGDLVLASKTSTVGELVSQLPMRHTIVPWDLSANDALERAAEANAELVIVVDPRTNELVGLVAAADIARMVTLQTLAKGPPRNVTPHSAAT